MYRRLSKLREERRPTVENLKNYIYHLLVLAWANRPQRSFPGIRHIILRTSLPAKWRQGLTYTRLPHKDITSLMLQEVQIYQGLYSLEDHFLPQSILHLPLSLLCFKPQAILNLARILRGRPPEAMPIATRGPVLPGWISRNMFRSSILRKTPNTPQRRTKSIPLHRPLKESQHTRH